jgi:hypothetical protein
LEGDTVEGPGSFFFGVAKVFFYIAVGLGCLSLALYGLAAVLQWLAVVTKPSSGVQGSAAPGEAPQATRDDKPDSPRG